MVASDRHGKRVDTSPKLKRCFRCQTRTKHIYNHGEKMYVCTRCEL